MKTALIHGSLYDGERFFTDQYVLFETEIEKCGPMSEFSPVGLNIIDAHGQWIMPSLVAGHTHVYSLFARGLTLPFSPRSFTDILRQLWWKIDAKLDHDMIRASGVSAASEFLQNGVTAIIDHHASGSGILGSLEALRQGVCEDGGLRGVFCFETSDRFNPADCIRENQTILAKNGNGHFASMFGLHASMTLSEETLRAVKQALGDHPIHIHVAEGPEDEENCLRQTGERIVTRLDRHGLLNPDSLIAHAIHCDDDELALLKRRGCAVVLNVSSNLNNGVGLPDIGKLKASGIPILIGNDGLSSSMASEWQNVYFLAHHQAGITSFSLMDLKKMIDDTYAFASRRLGVRLGKIRPGYAADLVTIPYLPPTPVDSANVFGHLFFGLFNGFKPQNVFVAGRPLVRDYRLDPILAAKCQKSSHQAARLWAILEKENAPYEPQHDV